MQTRLLWRRSATAIGLYGSVALGLLGGLVAARELHPSRYGLFSLAVFGAGLLPGAARPHRRGGDDQVRLPLHDGRAVGPAAHALPAVDGAEDARRGDRLDRAADHRAVRRLALQHATACTTPFLLAALLPISFIPEAPGRRGARARRALRACAPSYNFLTAAAADDRARRSARTSASPRPCSGSCSGSSPARRAVSCGGAAARSPASRAAPPEPLGEDRSEIVRFVIRSSIGSTIVSLRAAVVPLLLGLVSRAAPRSATSGPARRRRPA